MKYSFVFGKLGKDSSSNDADAASTASGATNRASFSAARNSAHMGANNIGTVTSTGNMSTSETAEMHAEFVCGDRFADNFWSRDDRCISVLMHKLKNAKQTCNDILHVITARASLEEELGKKMLKISRASLGSEELGTIKDALRSVRAEMESTAKTHLELGKQLRTELEKPLTGFMDAQRQKRRAQTTVIQKTEGDRNTLRSQLRKLQDKRRSDTKKVGDLELQVNGLHGMGDPKLKAKLERAQAQQRATEKEYVDVRARLKDADQQWLHVWRSACDVFQVLEEERIEYLKNCLWTYTNLVSSACVADDEAMEKIRQDLEKICVADDIAEFIKTFGTGPPDPELGSSSASAGEPGSRGAADQDSSRLSPGVDSIRTAHSAMPAPAPGPTVASATAPAVSETPLSMSRTSTAQGTIASHHNAPVDYPTQSSAATGPSGTTRSSTMPMQASAAATRPPTQASVHQPRPASMHAAAGMAASPAMQGQPQQMANGDVMWNSRPASSMQGTFNDNSHYRRASNNDMYSSTSHQQQQQQQQQQLQQQYGQQRQNPQMMGSRPSDPGYMGTMNSMYSGVGVVDPRAPSSMGIYRTSTASPTPMMNQRPGTASQVGDISGGGYVAGNPQQQPHMGSPRSRASTYNGSAPAGNFGSLAVNTQMHPPGVVQPVYANNGAIPVHHPNSAPSSPYQQVAGRPMSSAGMHNPAAMAAASPQLGARPVSVMQAPQYANSGAVYRSATPVQQSPQYMANVMSRPPTQMSHSPVPHSHGGYPMAAAAPSPQPHQRTPSVAGSYQAPSQMQQRASSSSADPQSGDSSNKEILFYVRALYDYDAEAETELSIRDGDVISVLSVSPDGWWEGELTDRATGQPRRGTFPSNFTDPISNLTAG